MANIKVIVFNDDGISDEHWRKGNEIIQTVDLYLRLQIFRIVKTTFSANNLGRKITTICQKIRCQPAN